MSFLDKVEDIQKKPEHARQKIALVATIFSTGFIVMVGLSVANPLANIGGEKNQEVPGVASLADDIRGTASAAKPVLDQLKDSFNQMRGYSTLLNQKTEQQSQNPAVSNQATATDNTEAIDAAIPINLEGTSTNSYGENQ